MVTRLSSDLGPLVLLGCFSVLSLAESRDWYAAPDGRDGAMGTRQDPFDLQTALLHEEIGGGDTLHLKGGIYRHPDRSGNSLGYAFGLQGGGKPPVIVRNMEGERVTIDGGLHTATSPEPANVLIEGLEIIVSELEDPARRITRQSGSHPDLGCPRGGVTLRSGSDLRIVNCLIRNNGNGVGFWRTVSGHSGLYGNIIYDNGWTGPDRRHGHGIYTQNMPEHRKYISDNLVLDNYGRCVQAYGSARSRVECYQFTGNYFADRNRVSNVLFGGTSPACGNRDAEFRENLFYRATLSIGYNCPAHDVRVFDSGFIRGGIGIREGSTRISRRGNLVWRGESDRGGVPRDIVFFRKNPYDPNRANLVILQPTRSANSIQVGFDAFLKTGDRVRVQDARNFFGEPVLEFTYTGEAVDIPVAGSEESAYVILVERCTPRVSHPVSGAPMAHCSSGRSSAVAGRSVMRINSLSRVNPAFSARALASPFGSGMSQMTGPFSGM